jgi:hypothetical protein
MKERPIIFNTEMVQAILDGRKTQTRRVIKPSKYSRTQFKWYGEHPLGGWWGSDVDPNEYNIPPGHDEGFPCPYGAPGDLLWVRETWRICDGVVSYKADDKYFNYPCKPSIHMPKKYARIWLKVLDVRVERVQEISIKDIFAEGVDDMVLLPMESTPDLPEFHNCAQGQMRTGFEILWDSINAKRGYSWEINPYVWVIEFERITNKQDKAEERNG